jgi:hypothetical protein
MSACSSTTPGLPGPSKIPSEANTQHEAYKAMFGSSLPLSDSDWNQTLDWNTFKRQYYEQEGFWRSAFDQLNLLMGDLGKIDLGEPNPKKFAQNAPKDEENSSLRIFFIG